MTAAFYQSLRHQTTVHQHQLDTGTCFAFHSIILFKMYFASQNIFFYNLKCISSQFKMIFLLFEISKKYSININQAELVPDTLSRFCFHSIICILYLEHTRGFHQNMKCVYKSKSVDIQIVVFLSAKLQLQSYLFLHLRDEVTVFI